MAQIKCKECSFITEETETYCPECGALFVKPFLYIDEEKKIAEEFAKKTEPKLDTDSFDYKLKLLEEKCMDIRDELVKIRHLLNEKSNECQRCFTAAGISKANNFDDDIGNIVYKRKENLEEIDILLMEYRKLLNQLEQKYIELENSKEELELFKKSFK
jgi:RNA polymerase subunit RPABC4/transcription elongation factor Spt4